MKKLTERVLIFAVGIPAVYALIFLFPFCRHLPLNIAVTIFSAMGAAEFSAMLGKKNIHIPKIESLILGALAPAAVTLKVSLNFHEWIVLIMLMSGVLWALLSRIFSRSENLDSFIYRLAGCFSLIAYPGFFMYWIIQMTIWENSGIVFLFLLLTFGNDSTAWLFGMLFGRNNRGLIPASPNKSIAGFIGGLIGSVVISVGAVLLFPSIFSDADAMSASRAMVITAIALGFLTGVFASLGDLAESAIKRSCDFKDSGNIMLGRGGILDSIDSIAVAAPVFYLLFAIFFR